MLIPKKLSPGATIGFVAPARWPKPEWLDAASALLTSKGYQVKIHPQNHLHDGQLGGSDRERAQAINDMFADKTVDTIVCTRGGTGSFRTLDHIDFDLIKKNPKIFCGFSDITTLLHAIHKRTGLVTFHGPMGWNFANTTDPRTLADFLGVVDGSKTDYVCTTTALRKGKASGRLIGGNMHLLRDLIGTSDDWATDDCILFIEDVDEVLYKLDNILWQFKRSGKFKNLKGVIVGEMVEVFDAETGFARAGEQPYGRDWPTLLRDVLPANIPVCLDFPCGHGSYLTTLPLGIQVELDVSTTQTSLKLLGASVQ
jgi:muramoyltetrapeptide carboxypeptidase